MTAPPPWTSTRKSASARVQIVRKQVVEAGRNRPVPVEQRADQYINGNVAWNLAPPANSPAGTAPVPTLQPTTVEERSAEIWLSTQGFLKAALANRAITKRSKGGAEISFSPDGQHRYVGTLNARNQLEKVRTWIDNPVLDIQVAEVKVNPEASLAVPAEIAESAPTSPAARTTASPSTKVSTSWWSKPR